MRLIVFALLGVLVAAAVALAASRLASQQIGLASEPVSAGDALAPRVAGYEPGRSRQEASPRSPRVESEVAPKPEEPTRSDGGGDDGDADD